MKNTSLQLTADSELFSILLICACVYIALRLLFTLIPERKKAPQPKESPLPFVMVSNDRLRLTKNDFRLMTTITALYAVVSLHMLGSTVFPVTTWQPDTDKRDVVFELKDETAFDGIYIIYGEGDNNSNPDSYQLGLHGLKVYGSNDYETWDELGEIEGKGIYRYTICEGSWDYRYVWIASKSFSDTITEFGLRKADHSGFVTLENVSDSHPSETYPASLLTDEQDLLVMYPTYMDEAYFDEVYHPRNAWEIANGQRMYATVHPLLGTNIMALFIRLFGMNPFVWRLAGALFGIGMVPVMYCLCKLLFRKTFACACGAILLGADFMHITTSRIGTLEPFSVFFIMLMFYYMIRYCKTSFYDTSLKKQLYLLFMSGLFTGIGIAVKWTACYSAVGLAAILFASWIKRFIEFRKAKDVIDHPEEYSEEQLDQAQMIRRVFFRRLLVTAAWCFVFFIFIPIAIYLVSYLPDKVWGDRGWSVRHVWDQCVGMYKYHVNLDATHPFQSSWYMWLLDIRPIWYHASTDGAGAYHTISCFSNPLLTWAGLPAIVAVTASVITERQQNAWLILVGYLSALLPWVSFVERCVFAYHFYPTSIFTALAIVWVIDRLMRTSPNYRKPVILFMAVYVIVFVIYLPVTCGFGTSVDYINALELFTSWHFG